MKQSTDEAAPHLSRVRTMDSSAETNLPLCVDLDGTLLRSNSLLEAMLALVSQRPQALLFIPFWLLRGQAYTWKKIVRYVKLDVSLLPYAASVVSFIQSQKKARRIVLITGAHYSIAKQVAQYLGGFDAVYGSRGRVHLVGRRKEEWLRRKFGDKGFDYVGDSNRDLRVWRRARHAYLAGNGSLRLAEKMRTAGVGHTVVPTQSAKIGGALFKALRPHQWTKNLLVLVPLMLHHMTNITLIWRGVATFGLFCMAASAMYLLNDLLDLESDRAHETKRHRPLASAQLAIGAGIWCAGGLVVLALGLGLWMSPGLALIILLYMQLTLLYSVWLKKFLIIDVVVLACLYILRMIAGAAAINIYLSFWTLAFSLFFFFSLALMKRYAELRNRLAQGKKHNGRRGYELDDLHQISTLGIGSGLIAVLVVGLYINSAEVRQLYRTPDLLWLMCPSLLAWISRLWILTSRGQMDEDPVAYAFRDLWSISVGALVALIGIAAL